MHFAGPGSLAHVSLGLHQSSWFGFLCLYCLHHHVKASCPRKSLDVLQCTLRPDTKRLMSCWVRTARNAHVALHVYLIYGLKTCLFLDAKEQPPLLNVKHKTW